ncbi:MAG: magnesium transport protein CorA [Armatimonadota bacterium]|nr:MAG: magnesium transport protein CorA [Armatimonadota bacterium]
MTEQTAQTMPYHLKAAHWQPPDPPARLDETAAIEAFERNLGVIWVDVTACDVSATSNLLTQRFGFHPLAVEDALSPYERPALQRHDDVLFLAAHAVLQQDGEEVYHEIGFFLGGYFLVTVHVEPVPLIDQWFERWIAHPERVGKTSAHLLHLLLDAIVDGYFPISDTLEEKADDLEDAIFTGNGRVQVADILQAKRRLLQLRQHITPLRDILNALLRRDVEIIPDEVVPYLQDVYDHTLRIAELADINRDILAGVLDAHLSVVSNRLNEVMRILTVISTILMSAALIAGIYGMNFVHMPELQWKAGYPFAGAMMVLVGMVEWYIFKRKGWV